MRIYGSYKQTCTNVVAAVANSAEWCSPPRIGLAPAIAALGAWVGGSWSVVVPHVTIECVCQHEASVSLALPEISAEAWWAAGGAVAALVAVCACHLWGALGRGGERAGPAPRRPVGLPALRAGQ